MAGPTLESRLQANGCGIPVAAFQDQLAELMERLHPAWTVDELLLHPTEALTYCVEARQLTGFPDVPDDLILRCLIARRKNP
jgi:hypothetical protein